MLSSNGVVILANKYEEKSWLELEHEIKGTYTLKIQSEVKKLIHINENLLCKL